MASPPPSRPITGPSWSPDAVSLTRRWVRGVVLGLGVAIGATAAGAEEWPPLPPLPPDPAVVPAQLPPLPEPPPLGLRPPEDPVFPDPEPLPSATLPPGQFFRTLMDPPPGFAGKSGVERTEPQTNPSFVPIEDRWRIGYPDWDRYGKGHPLLDEYPFQHGRLVNPYRQNVLKGDYPILGQHTFIDLSASQLTFMEYRRIPTQTTPFESTARADTFPFFGRPSQYFFTQFNSVSIDLFHGDAAFKPVDWRIKVTPVFNVNYLATNELAQVNPSVTAGTTRGRTFFALQEFFGEVKLADISPNYDFVSARVGSQLFISDFRGFIFSDINRGARIFGTRNNNRDQFNLLYNRQFEKDTNSGLNSFHDRQQNIFIANYYRQDFVFPGYTAQASVHYNNDRGSFKLDKNRRLVRPDPTGIFQQHQVDAVYLGFTGDGHWNRFNVTNAFYWVVGRDSLNPLANRSQLISAQLGAFEISYDRDWMRFRTAMLVASGDSNINNGHATGFDSILDQQIFAAGIFGYLQRQSIPIFGVNLLNSGSLLPDLRSSKIQGQSNFVNPGLVLFNVGQDMDLTPKLKMVNNMNFVQFAQTSVLEQFLYAGNIHRTIGVEPSSGFEYRPFLNDAAVLVTGVAALLPGLGFRDIYSNLGRRVDTPVAAFASLVLSF